MKDPQRLVQATVGVPAIGGNDVRVLRNGDEIFPAMLEAIRGAQDSVQLETYVYWTGDIADEMGDALAERAEAGVDVRVLVDWVGGRLMRDELVEQLRDAGARFHWFRPPRRVARAAISLDEGLVGQHRTHRKVLVCDGTVGFTGGVGIAEEWTGDARSPDEWRDTHLRIQGPAVASLVSAFATNWHESAGPLPLDVVRETTDVGDTRLQVVRGQPGRFVSDIALLYRALLDAAEERILISTAYLVPDDETSERLCAAVARGVDVRVLVPGPHVDKRVSRLAARDSFDVLLEGGVELYEFLPTMMHCKTAVIDDVSLCGSANLNMRSLSQDDEVVVVVHDTAITAVFVEHFEQDLERAERMVAGRFAQRSTWQRFVEGSVGIFRRFL